MIANRKDWMSVQCPKCGQFRGCINKKGFATALHLVRKRLIWEKFGKPKPRKKDAISLISEC